MMTLKSDHCSIWKDSRFGGQAGWKVIVCLNARLMRQVFMTATETSPTPIIDIEQLSFEQGAHLLLKRALAQIPVGGRLGVKGRSPELPVHLRAWCRAQGHEVIWNEAEAQDTDSPLIAWIVRGSSSTGRWRDAQQV